MRVLWSFSSLAVLLILASCTCDAQWDGTCTGTVTFDSVYAVSISQSLPSYRIRLIERADTSTEYPRWTYEITISQEATQPSAQVICGESNDQFWLVGMDKYPGIEFIDLNFDGFKDIKMFMAMSANGTNKGYDAYVFDPAKRIFTHHAQLSEILDGTFVKLDPQKRRITTGGRGGCGPECWDETTYEVRGDSLVLVREESQDRNAETDELYHVVREVINGVLTVVSREKVEYK